MKQASSGSAPSGNGSPPLVFVVDDEPMLLELATVILEGNGFRVETFRSPDKALEMFQRSHPRPVLLITDYSMHTMTGMDLINGCRKLEPKQKILMVSGTVDEGVYHRSEQKPNHFLAKPYVPRQLLEAVDKVLGVTR